MATNLQVDDKLIIKAVKLGRHKTKKAAVTKALIEYIDHLEQEKILYRAHDMINKLDQKFNHERLDELLAILNMENIYTSI